MKSKNTVLCIMAIILFINFVAALLMLQMLSQLRIIHPSSCHIPSVKNTESINGKMKLVLPILFIFIFVLVGYFKSFYQKQLAKHNA